MGPFKIINKVIEVLYKLDLLLKIISGNIKKEKLKLKELDNGNK